MIVRIIVYGLIGWALFALAGCPETLPNKPQRFQKGEIVRHALSGYRGQVIYAHCGQFRCWYDVRFVFPEEQTASSFLGPDGTVRQRPIALVESMHDFELEKL